MNKITAILILSAFMLSTMMASAKPNVSVCDNHTLCDNTTLPDAFASVDKYGIVTLMGNYFTDNTTMISKSVTLNGNGYTISLDKITTTGLLIKDATDVNVLNLTINQTSGSPAGGTKGAVGGIVIQNSTNIYIDLYNSIDLGIAIYTDRSSNIVVSRYNFISSLYDPSLPICEPPAIYVNTGTENIIFTAGGVAGYPKAVDVNTNGVVFKESKFERNGNVIYVKNVDGFTVNDSIFEDNGMDMKLSRLTNYTISNNTLSSAIVLPNGDIVDVTNYNISDITIGNKTYPLASALDIKASCDETNCTLRIYYNKTLVTKLNMDTSTFKVWHVTNETTGDGEWITPMVNSKEGYVELTVSSFSPFYLVADQLPVSAQSSSGSGSGSSSSGSSTGSSGGGAAASPESYNNIAKQESRQGYFYASKETIYTYTTLNITEVRITPAKSIGEVYVKVEELRGKSNLTKSIPEGEVIQYFNIWAGTSGTSALIEKAIIQLKYDDVALLRWNNDTLTWNNLKETEDGFETQGFSSFAIVKKTLAVTTTISDTSETRVTQQSSQVAPDQTPKETPGFAVVLAILSFVLVIVYRRRQKN